MPNVTGTGGNERGNYYLEDVLVGRRQQINFRAGSNITIVAVEDPDRHEVSYTITATGGGGVTDHAALTGVTSDQHHADSHADTKHTTHPAHSVLSGIGADDHHVSFLVADHAALPSPHHVAFVTADHNALANPHHSNANDHANTLDHAQNHTDTQHTDGPNSKTSHTHTHAATTGQTANDHHAQSHTMSQHTDGPYGGASTTRAYFLS